jgi:hypothetical protein
MLLPGPEAQQLTVYIGWLLHRTPGGVVGFARYEVGSTRCEAGGGGHAAGRTGSDVGDDRGERRPDRGGGRGGGAALVVREQPPGLGSGIAGGAEQRFDFPRQGADRLGEKQFAAASSGADGLRQPFIQADEDGDGSRDEWLRWFGPALADKAVDGPQSTPN